MSHGPLSMKTVLGKTTGIKPQYDYDRQAWTVINAAGVRVYIRCGHPDDMECGCYGRAHHNQPVKNADLDERGNLKLRR